MSGSPVNSNHELWFKRGIVTFTTLMVFVGGPLLMKPLSKLKGKGLNSNAWRSSYSERFLAVPPGPREGWWGIHLSPVHDAQLGIVLPERHVPGYFDIQAGGIQTAYSKSKPQVHLLIIGGSVAAGAYASNLPRTYFHQLALRLQDEGCPVRISVLATGAWTSVNEVQALRYRGLQLQPQYVMFLDGLNDLTLDQVHPEAERVRRYLEEMRTARDLALAHHIRVIFAPQPFLPEKIHKTGLEMLIEAESYSHIDRLTQAYNQLRAGLKALTVPGQVYLVDCAGVFDKPPRTVFADIWHFSDVGHSMLSKWLTRGLLPIFQPSSTLTRLHAVV